MRKAQKDLLRGIITEAFESGYFFRPAGVYFRSSDGDNRLRASRDRWGLSFSSSFSTISRRRHTGRAVKRWRDFGEYLGSRAARKTKHGQ